MTFSVSEFNQFTHTYLQSIGEVTVQGEISELRVSQGKWLFVTLQDSNANLSVFGTVYQIHNLKELEEGMEVTVYGVPSLHQKSGRFSLTASAIQPTGEGALKRAFEKLKAELTAEGLFADERKRPLPRFPEKIGLITAKGSQAYNDFVKVLGERMGGLEICYFPASVQGVKAVDELVSAITFANRDYRELDVIIVTRGGGSLEDLMAFNDERVVRALFASKTPVVSAVGHEGDVSLSDLVADLRASTPSNAAELITHERTELQQHVEYMQRRIEQTIQHAVDRMAHSISTQEQKIVRFLEHQRQRIQTALRSTNILPQHIYGQIQKVHSAILLTEKDLLHLMRDKVRETAKEVDKYAEMLSILDYRNVLKRGFSIPYTESGALLSSVDDVKQGAKIKNVVHDGEIWSTVD